MVKTEVTGQKGVLEVGQVGIGSLQEGNDFVSSSPPLACLLVQTLSRLHC